MSIDDRLATTFDCIWFLAMLHFFIVRCQELCNAAAPRHVCPDSMAHEGPQGAMVHEQDRKHLARGMPSLLEHSRLLALHKLSLSKHIHLLHANNTDLHSKAEPNDVLMQTFGPAILEEYLV